MQKNLKIQQKAISERTWSYRKVEKYRKEKKNVKLAKDWQLEGTAVKGIFEKDLDEGRKLQK